ncbi:hypothetical protein HYH03_009565 [Edaphochlamys debaryana]|uniref:STI1 domain-containing protein n=1 Tax=Edaphochlamys debaryana TaxID=47281 RepID=A0A835XYQ9_9CHLO|nr:hypothetical protein HYH03_009565 [Edaphochlamys debaryana]|eukprot:KAG2492067.1 hypothetical protein HYH03_009565 [Edaphochlamys debaryana]
MRAASRLVGALRSAAAAPLRHGALSAPLLDGVSSSAGVAKAPARWAPALSAAGSSLPASTQGYASAPSEEALRKAEKMVDLMASSPQMQQMMLTVMPPGFRNPDMLKQMFADPGARRKIAEMIAKRGFNIPDHLLDRMNPASMDATFERSRRLGLDPGSLFSKLMGHPGLLAKLQEPRVMTAFLDIAEDPSRQSKYEGDKELLEVVLKVREILGSSKPASGAPASPDASASSASSATAIPLGSPSPSSSTSSDASSTSAFSDSASSAGGPDVVVGERVPPPPGSPPRFTADADSSAAAASGAGAGPGEGGGASQGFNPLVALMSSDPKTVKWLSNPTVMAALEEVHQKPWKTFKYIMNRDVMEAFGDLKQLMRGKKP